MTERSEVEEVEEVELFGGPELLFGYRHLPAGPIAGGVVICSSGLSDAVDALDQRRGSRLGRRLAQAGLAVQRFHYRGTGSSDGNPAALSFPSMVDDARRAFDLVRSGYQIDRVGLVGVRLGALVAARLARDLADAPLAVWEPVVDPRRVLTGAMQAGADASIDPLAGLLGTPLAGELFEGTLVGSLVDEIGTRSRAVLVVQTAGGPQLCPEYESLVARLRAHRLTVDVACHSSDALVDHTAAWLATRLVPSASAW